MKARDFQAIMYGHLPKAEGRRRIKRDAVLDIVGLSFRSGYRWPYTSQAQATMRYVCGWDVWMRNAWIKHAPGM